MTNEIDYNALFGLTENGEEQPAEGEKEQQPADAVDTDAGLEPDEDTQDEALEEEPASAAPDKKLPETEDKPPMSREERAKNAAARRKAETEAAVEKARAEERGKAENTMKEFFLKAGLKNPLDGDKPITTLEEFDAYKAQYDQAQLQRDLSAGKLTPEGLQRIIDQSPAMQQVKALLAQQTQNDGNEQQQQEQAQIESELREINRLDPNIRTVEDLMKMPNAQDFYARVKAGMNFLDAYRLVNFERLRGEKAAAAQQQAINRISSKDHLTPTRTRGTAPLSVPEDVRRACRDMMPDATDEDIQLYYNKYHKQ